ncbi:MAG: hypothetical protein OTJ44_02470 [Planctomycetota bacterium]|nr:hypothetical protein [Planctomycetota bacterium]
MRLLPLTEGLHSAEAFSRPYLESFLELVRSIERSPLRYANALDGYLIATVFEEPSTRTRLSFEAAAHRLGARVISISDPRSSSSVKGETLSDAARVMGGYADLLVWRHPRDGASRRAAQVAGVPVINGGDGRLGHPTQTLVDLSILHQKWGVIEGKTVGILGDIQNGRTARSLAWSLAVLGARILLLPGSGLDWEPGFENRLMHRFAYRLKRVRHPLIQEWTGNPEARMLEPKGLVQGELFGVGTSALHGLDALYLTRLQEERGAKAHRGGYPGITVEQLKDPLLQDTLLLHPLPRRDELPVAVDEDPRALYFEQANMGPRVRQAVFLSLLCPEKVDLPALNPLPSGNPEHFLAPCPNKNCITHAEGLRPPWRVEGKGKRIFLCSFCDVPLEAPYVGCLSSRKVHPAYSPLVQQIRPENLVPFQTRDQAEKEDYSWGGG